MLASLRTYRLLAAFLAALLLLSGSMPLVQPVCAMAARPRQAHDQPCPHRVQEQAPCPRDLQGHAQKHGLPHEQAEHPSPHAAHSDSHAAPHQASPGDCCAVQAAQGILPNGVLQAKRSLEPPAAFVAVAFLDDLPQPGDRLSHALFFDLGPPPPAAISLHLLHGVLLN